MAKEPSTGRVLNSLKGLIRSEGVVEVVFDCGGDETSVVFRGLEQSHNSNEMRMIRERIINLLNLPNASESSVEGGGEVSIGPSGSIELVYSLCDVHYDYFPIEVENYPVKDVQYVCVSTPTEFPPVDLEVSIKLDAWGRCDDWDFLSEVKTTPVLEREPKKIVAEFVSGILGPILESVETPYAEMKEGTVGVSGFEFEGFSWHSTKEMHYSYSISRVYVKRNVKNENLTLFE